MQQPVHMRFTRFMSLKHKKVFEAMTGFAKPFPVALTFNDQLLAQQSKPEIAPTVIPPVGRRHGRFRLPFRPLSKRASLDHRDGLRAQCQGPEPCSTALLSGDSRLLNCRKGPIPSFGPQTRFALAATREPEHPPVVECSLRDPERLLAVAVVGDFCRPSRQIDAGLASYPRRVNPLCGPTVKRRIGSGRPATLALCRVRPATGATVTPTGVTCANR